jgi:hypothetical protein
MTAVEWLYEKLWIQSNYELLSNEIFEQALELEKHQIMEAFQYKFFHPYAENEPEIYYDETYKSTKK